MRVGGVAARRTRATDRARARQPQGARRRAGVSARARRCVRRCEPSPPLPRAAPARRTSSGATCSPPSPIGACSRLARRSAPRTTRDADRLVPSPASARRRAARIGKVELPAEGAPRPSCRGPDGRGERRRSSASRAGPTAEPRPRARRRRRYVAAWPATTPPSEPARDAAVRPDRFPPAPACDAAEAARHGQGERRRVGDRDAVRRRACCWRCADFNQEAGDRPLRLGRERDARRSRRAPTSRRSTRLSEWRRARVRACGRVWLPGSCAAGECQSRNTSSVAVLLAVAERRRAACSAAVSRRRSTSVAAPSTVSSAAAAAARRRLRAARASAPDVEEDGASPPPRRRRAAALAAARGTWPVQTLLDGARARSVREEAWLSMFHGRAASRMSRFAAAGRRRVRAACSPGRALRVRRCRCARWWSSMPRRRAAHLGRVTSARGTRRVEGGADRADLADEIARRCRGRRASARTIPSSGCASAATCSPSIRRGGSARAPPILAPWPPAAHRRRAAGRPLTASAPSVGSRRAVSSSGPPSRVRRRADVLTPRRRRCGARPPQPPRPRIVALLRPQMLQRRRTARRCRSRGRSSPRAAERAPQSRRKPIWHAMYSGAVGETAAGRPRALSGSSLTIRLRTGFRGGTP